MHRLRLLGATIVLAVTASAMMPGAAEASASKPRPITPFSTNQIVVHRSLGGIKLGSTLAQAGRHFPAGQCGRSGCSYQSPGNAYTVYFNMHAKDARHTRRYVGRVTMGATVQAVPIRRLRDARGIGIGSTAAALKSAYPGLQGSHTYYYLQTPTRLTTFSIRSGRVVYLSISIR